MLNLRKLLERADRVARALVVLRWGFNVANSRLVVMEYRPLARDRQNVRGAERLVRSEIDRQPNLLVDDRLDPGHDAKIFNHLIHVADAGFVDHVLVLVVEFGRVAGLDRLVDASALLGRWPSWAFAVAEPWTLPDHLDPGGRDVSVVAGGVVWCVGGHRVCGTRSIL